MREGLFKGIDTLEFDNYAELRKYMWILCNGKLDKTIRFKKYLKVRDIADHFEFNYC